MSFITQGCLFGHSEPTKFWKRLTSQRRKHVSQSNTKFFQTAGFTFILAKTRFSVEKHEYAAGDWAHRSNASKIGFVFRVLQKERRTSPEVCQTFCCLEQKVQQAFKTYQTCRFRNSGVNQTQIPGGGGITTIYAGAISDVKWNTPVTRLLKLPPPGKIPSLLSLPFSEFVPIKHIPKVFFICINESFRFRSQLKHTYNDNTSHDLMFDIFSFLHFGKLWDLIKFI